MSWIKDLEDREIPYSLVRMMTNGNSIRNFGTDQNCTQRMDFRCSLPWMPWIIRITADFGSQHVQCFTCGYGSIPINTIFSGMNIHLPAILMFTRGTRFWPTPMFQPARHRPGILGTFIGYWVQASEERCPKGLWHWCEWPEAHGFRIHGAQLAVLSSRAQGVKDESTLW